MNSNSYEFQLIIQSTNIGFDVTAISESRIIKKKQSVVDINLPNYSYESCPTESSTVGTLLYIRNHLPYKLRKKLNTYKSYELESSFIEINNATKK